MSRRQRKEMLTLAFLVALLPPLWAVAAPHLQISVSPIALICAGIYVANGNRFRDAMKISLGFLAGDLWALLSLKITESSLSGAIGASTTLFITLFLMGFLAVVIAMHLPRVFFLPAWLSGWAIGMLTLNLTKVDSPVSLTVQIGASMLAGVYYVGALVDKLQRLMLRETNDQKE